MEEERDEKVFTDFIEKMEAFARDMGLYVVTAHGKRMPIDGRVMAGFDPVDRPFVAATFIIGDEAFTDRVQNPQLYTDDAMLAQIEHATRASDAEELLRRYETTGKLFREDDDV